jgi:hypothetical protein
MALNVDDRMDACCNHISLEQRPRFIPKDFQLAWVIWMEVAMMKFGDRMDACSMRVCLM